MNRVYKIILNGFTGESIVASELAKGKNQKATLISVTALLTALGAPVMAETLIYDGTDDEDKLQLAVYSNQLPAWLRSKDQLGILANSDVIVSYEENTANVPAYVIGRHQSVDTLAAAIGRIENTQVTIAQGKVAGDVLGGIVDATAITQERVARPAGIVAGAATNNSRHFTPNIVSDDNQIAVQHEGLIQGDAIGGLAQILVQTGHAKGGDINNYEYARATTSANASVYVKTGYVAALNNSVISEGYIAGQIYGGQAAVFLKSNGAEGGNALVLGTVQAQAESAINAELLQIKANNNSVALSNDHRSEGQVVGGAAYLTVESGQAVGGKVQIQSSVVTQSQADSSILLNGANLDANNNSVTIGKGQTSQAIIGGDVKLFAHSGDAVAGQASNYSIAFVNADAKSNIHLSNSTINVLQNTVEISEGANTQSHIYGGRIQWDIAAGSANAGQKIEVEDHGPNLIDDPIVTSIGTGNATAILDLSNTVLTIANNEITFDGHSSLGDIYGGYVSYSVQVGAATLADLGLGDASVSLAGSSVNVTNNRVTIGENATFAGNTSLYGGQLVVEGDHHPETIDIFSGNTLVFSAKQAAKFDNVSNFENYQFTLNPIYVNSQTALLTANNIIFGANIQNVTGGDAASIISVVGIHSGDILWGGDEFILIHALENMAGDVSGLFSEKVEARQGISLLYDVQTKIDLDNKKVTAVIIGEERPAPIDPVEPTVPVDPEDGDHNNVGAAPSEPAAPADPVSPEKPANPEGPIKPAVRVNPQLKALSEGRLSSALQVTRGADVIAFDIFKTIAAQNGNQGFAPFIQISGSHARYNSGSHVTANDYIAVLGLSYQQNNLTAAAFLEAGWGDYDTYNSFSNAAEVRGNGNNRYFGLGLFGRYEWENGIYTDGSVRIGRAHNRFSTNDLVNIVTSENARYKVNSRYSSAHLGLGYIYQINDQYSADISTKYLWTELAGKKVDIAGDPINFKKVQSKRLRLDARLNYAHNDQLTVYGGIGYEREFDGKAKATTYRIFDIEAPSVRGNTGILSIGVSAKPSAHSPLTLDAGIEGYIGKRRGGSISLKVRYSF